MIYIDSLSSTSTSSTWQTNPHSEDRCCIFLPLVCIILRDWDPNFIHIIDSKPELEDVFKKLFHLAHEWKSIGILLGMEHDLLKDIEKEEHEVDDCLSSMLSEWLKMANPPTTWKNVVDAVQVVDSSAAQEIEKTLAHWTKLLRWTFKTPYNQTLIT